MVANKDSIKISDALILLPLKSPPHTWPSHTLTPLNRRARGRGVCTGTDSQGRNVVMGSTDTTALPFRLEVTVTPIHSMTLTQWNTSYPSFRVLQRVWVFTKSSHLLCLWRLASWLEWGYRWDGARGIMGEAASHGTAHSSVALQATSVESTWPFKQGSLQTSK